MVGGGNGGGDGVIDCTSPVDLVAGVARFGSGSACGGASMNHRCAAAVGRGNGGGDGVIDGTDPVDLVAGVALFGSGSASGGASVNQLSDSSDDDKSSSSSASLSPDCSALVAV